MQIGRLAQSQSGVFEPLCRTKRAECLGLGFGFSIVGQCLGWCALCLDHGRCDRGHCRPLAGATSTDRMTADEAGDRRRASRRWELSTVDAPSPHVSPHHAESAVTSTVPIHSGKCGTAVLDLDCARLHTFSVPTICLWNTQLPDKPAGLLALSVREQSDRYTQRCCLWLTFSVPKWSSHLGSLALCGSIPARRLRPRH